LERTPQGGTSPCPPARLGPAPPLPSPPAKAEEVWSNKAGFFQPREDEFERWTVQPREVMPYGGGANFDTPYSNPAQHTAMEAAFILFDIDGDGEVSLRDLSHTMARRGHAASDTEIQKMMELVVPFRRESSFNLQEFTEFFMPLMAGRINMTSEQVFARCMEELEMASHYAGHSWGTWHPELFAPEKEFLVTAAWGVTPLRIQDLREVDQNDEGEAVWRADNVWCRTGIEHRRPHGTEWMAVDGQMSMVSCSPTGLVWATDAEHQVWVRQGVTQANPRGDSWVQVLEDSLSRSVQPALKWNAADTEAKVRHTTGKTQSSQIRWICASGVGSVWGVDVHGEVVARVGVSETNHMGDTWVRVGGQMERVAVGPTGHVWAVNRQAQVFVRRGITARRPLGVGWFQLDGKLKTVSVGVNAVWGIDDTDRVWCRMGLSDAKAEGNAWAQVPGQMRDISVGPTGIVWATSDDSKLWIRTGTSKNNPTGDAWAPVDGNIVQISAGGCQLY